MSSPGKCPFCGSASVYIGDIEGTVNKFAVSCEDCGAHGPIRGGEEAAVRGWAAASPDGVAERLEHWRSWAALYDPCPEEPARTDNERRAHVNWWVEMVEGTREPSAAFLRSRKDGGA